MTNQLSEAEIMKEGGRNNLPLSEAEMMRSHEALLRVCDLVEVWERILQNRNNIIWSEMDAGDTARLRKSIDEVKAAIHSPNVEDNRSRYCQITEAVIAK